MYAISWKLVCTIISNWLLAPPRPPLSSFSQPLPRSPPAASVDDETCWLLPPLAVFESSLNAALLPFSPPPPSSKQAKLQATRVG